MLSSKATCKQAEKAYHICKQVVVVVSKCQGYSPNNIPVIQGVQKSVKQSFFESNSEQRKKQGYSREPFLKKSSFKD